MSELIDIDCDIQSFEVVSGCPAEIYAANDPTTQCSAIVWWDDDTRYIISGFFDNKTLIAMAESVTPRPRDYHLGHIPEGYSQYLHEQTRGFSSWVYLDEEDNIMRFSYTRERDGTAMYFVHDNHTRYDTTVHGLAADLFMGNDAETDSGLIWIEDDTVFSLCGFFSQEELERIANSVTESTVTYGG